MLKIRQGLERLGSWKDTVKKSRGRKAILVSFALLISLNIILSVIPAGVSASSGSTVESWSELVEAIENSYYDTTVIKISKSFEIYDTVVIDEWTDVKLTSSFGNCTLTRAGGFDGSLFEVNGGSLTIGSGITVDGGRFNTYAPIITAENYATVVLDGGILTNNCNNSHDTFGGAILADNSEVIVKDGQIVFNYCDYYGGAVYLVNDSSFTMTGGMLNSNSTYMGGGIYAEGSKVVITGGEISSNTAYYMGGGAYFVGGGSSADALRTSVSITGSPVQEECSVVIANNTASVGAGICFSNKGFVQNSRDEFVISGAVCIDNNENINYNGDVLPGTESNIFIETANDAPELANINPISSIGLYPLISGTAITSDQNYISNTDSAVFYDYDESSLLLGGTTYAGGKITVSTAKTSAILGSYTNGSVVTDMGCTINNLAQVNAGFPVHLVAVPESDNIVTAIYVSDGTNRLDGSNGSMWYCFNGTQGAGQQAEKVYAEFAAADVVATVDGIGYATLQDAVNACIGKRDCTIVLTGNVEQNDTVQINTNQCITIKTDPSFVQGTAGGTAATDKRAVISRSGSNTEAVFELDINSVLVLDGVKLDGAGVEAYEPLVEVYYGELELANGTTIENGTNTNDGGAVSLESGVLTIGEGCKIANNSAYRGGGVYMEGDSTIIGDGSASTTEINSNKFVVSGGGVYMEDGVIDGCDISLNTPVASSGTMGGGVYIVSGKVVNSSVGAYAQSNVSNRADVGAGIYAESAALENVVILNNNAYTAAGGVFFAEDLVLSGLVKISGNKALGADASNLYIKNEDDAVVNISGRLDGDSSVGVFLSSSEDADVADQIIFECETAQDSAANAGKISLDNSTVLYPLADDNFVTTVKASECITINLVKAEGSEDFTIYPDGTTSVHLKADGGSARFDVEYGNGMVLNATPVGNAPIYVNKDFNDASCCTIELYFDGTDADKGKTFSVEIDASYTYEQATLYDMAQINNVQSEYFADNYSYYDDITEVFITYEAVKVNSSAYLIADYFKYSTSSGTEADAVKTQLSKVKGDTDSYSGYVKLVATVPDYVTGDPAPLGSPSEVPYVTVTVDVSGIAEDGERLDFVVYNGEPQTTASNGSVSGGAVRMDDLLVKDGVVSFDARRSTGANADTIYFALLEHAEDAAAKIGTKKYRTLYEAFEAVADEGVIELLRDVTIQSSLVLDNGKEVTVTSADGFTIRHGAGFDGSMFYVGSESELILDNVVIDGGADIYTTSPFVNSGVDLRAAAVVNYGKLTVTDCAIVDCANVSGYQEGSALYNAYSGIAVIDGTEISGCYAASEGGAVCNFGNLQLTDCTVENNTAKQEAGAILNYGRLTLESTGVIGNDCIDNGAGGICNYGSLNLEGEVYVTSNANFNGTSNLYTTSYVTLTDELSSGARIGVSYPNVSGDTVAVGDEENVDDASDYLSNFFPDTVNLKFVGKSGEVRVGSTSADYVTVTLKAGENGLISPAGEIRVVEGSDLNITVTPSSEGGVLYAVEDLLVGSTSVLSAATIDSSTRAAAYKLSDIEDDVTVSASFKLNPETAVVPLVVTVPSSSVGGTISPSVPVLMNSVESVDFTVKPAAGYYLEKLTLAGKDVMSKATENADGSFVCTVTGVTGESATLQADFKPIMVNTTLEDAASGVSVTGKLHYQAYLTVENLADAYPSTYNLMLAKLTNTSGISQYIASAYEIRLNFDNEIEMADVDKYDKNTGLTITFNMGSSYAKKTIRIFHGNGSTIDPDFDMKIVPDDGIISIHTNSLSPYGLVVQEEKSTGSQNNSNNSNSNSQNSGSNSSTDNSGKGPVVTGDITTEKKVPTVVIVLLVLSSLTVMYIVSRYYLPRLVKELRIRYRSR